MADENAPLGVPPSDFEALPFQRFPLNNLPNVRRSFARLIGYYARGKIDRDRYRDLVYGMSALVRCHEVADVEQRIAAIERALEGGKP